MTDRFRLGLLLVAELCLIVGLHALSQAYGFAVDWSDPAGSVEQTSLEDVVGAVTLVLALGLAYWLLVSTVSFLLASLSGRPPLVRVVRRFTLAPIRRLTSRAAALSIVASAVTGPLVPVIAHFDGDGTRVIVEVGQDEQLQPPPTRESEDSGDDLLLPPHLDPARRSHRPAGVPHPAERPSGDPPKAALDGSVDHIVTVRPGDHLWSLSQHHLEGVLSRTGLGEHEVAPYWVRVIDANRLRIKSGNPDLIYPGETIVLPAILAPSDR